MKKDMYLDALEKKMIVSRFLLPCLMSRLILNHDEQRTLLEFVGAELPKMTESDHQSDSFKIKNSVYPYFETPGLESELDLMGFVKLRNSGGRTFESRNFKDVKKHRKVT
ncbi:hypothetical protein TNCV_5019041 [Trichonephila clavipes]|nr:hypothetical protein TNCV_5019041 [Trichonephila clavipes]